ncbi:ABC transporter ATP-binding protein [Scardovia inopinata]|uniref:ABC transporter domain-containing protein n=1 Tax=Scardovia inopinata F0304 TaxID=641146 RepID=W5IID8_SCAIO|nr:ABC transporter ATP-binding protein [Scardovia inopinata]EFG26620.1 hypothetical protein HMPREF9020_00245 [Scardovia inopinata F0304]BAR06219.1 ABC transporter ATP-binding component [Scardovia inopinata JCM 12537]SUV51738.1 ABC transporter ATP-binding protein [Scardovia inopinata]
MQMQGQSQEPQQQPIQAPQPIQAQHQVPAQPSQPFQQSQGAFQQPLMPFNPSAAMSVRGLTKVFTQKIAVNNINLDIPTGSFYALVGPNGAGKTTTLKMATGLLRPTAGAVALSGTDVWSHLNQSKRQMGIMPDSDALFARLTGLQTLVYAAMLRGIDRETAKSRAHDLLTALDLTESANVLVQDYSAGMTKKIALGTSLIHSPKILVLDEPFEAVDPVSAANIRQILKNYAQSGGTVIISSHVMALVEQLCDHVAIISNGRILAAGTTAEVSNGMSLEDRFLSMVGGLHYNDNLTWLAQQVPAQGQAQA